MIIRAQIVKWALAAALFAGHLGPVSAAEITAYVAKGTAAQLAKCRIFILESYFWRDWMPIVERPGPDRGSPLRSKIKLRLENLSGETVTLSFRAAVLDGI